MHFSAFNSLRNTFKSGLVAFVFLFVSSFAFGGGGPAVGNGICEYAGLSGGSYSGSGSTACACTWYSLNADGSQGAVNCAYGNCGQAYLEECIWDCNGNHPNGTDQWARVCDITADPRCWFQGGGSAGELFCGNIFLPISLIDFSARNSEFNVNTVTWTTESEINNQLYIIENSTDGLTFVELQALPGAGNSNINLSYNFIHYNVESEINYYRLKQIDFNGEFAIYGPISIDNREQKRTLLKVCNMLGQEVNDNYRGIVIYHYSDGSYEKIYK